MPPAVPGWFFAGPCCGQAPRAFVCYCASAGPAAWRNWRNSASRHTSPFFAHALGTVLLAAQQVVLDLNAFVYQVPAGLSYATIVRTGQAAGRNSQPEVRRAANASLLIGLSFMAIAGAVFAGLSHLWASLYTNSPEVVSASQPIFTICAFLLMSDTAFVVLASALTGLGDTRTPMVVSLLSNWGVGMTLAYALTFHFHQSLRGLWIGRAVGSALAASALAVVWRVRLRRASRRETTLNLLDPLHVSVGPPLATPR